MFNARQLMIFYFYGTCNQKATIIQFQKLKESKNRRAEGHSGSDRFCCRIQRSDNYRVVFLGSHGLILTCTVQKVRTAS